MICYKTTSGCGVYESRSCSECPYSKPQTAKVIEHPGHEDEHYWYCSNCGSKDVYEEDKYCSQCGVKFKEN